MVLAVPLPLPNTAFLSRLDIAYQIRIDSYILYRMK
jgi:hypothetical protein